VNRLHEQEFALLLVDTPLNIMRTCLHSCASSRVGAWLLTCLTTLSFHLSLTHFLTTLCTCLGLPHPMVDHLSWCQCGNSTIDNLSMHFFQCPCKNEHTTTHDLLRDIVAFIILENGTHVQKEVSHLFLRHTR